MSQHNNGTDLRRSPRLWQVERPEYDTTNYYLENLEIIFFWMAEESEVAGPDIYEVVDEPGRHTDDSCQSPDLLLPKDQG